VSTAVDTAAAREATGGQATQGAKLTAADGPRKAADGSRLTRSPGLPDGGRPAGPNPANQPPSPATAIPSAPAPGHPASPALVRNATASPPPAEEGNPPEAVASQLASVLAPVARQADGSYKVSLRLQPDELGTVHVDLRLEAGTINVSLHAEGDAARDTLRQNLGQLREQLSGQGFATGQFDVSGGTGSGGSDQHNGPSGRPAADQLPVPDGVAESTRGATVVLGPGSSANKLDVRL